MRGVALLTDGPGHERAPFYFLPRLGGGGLMRGYETSRFIDTQAVLASAEYRWQAMRRLQVVSFVDVGQVAPSIDAFRLSDLRTSAGVGIRYRGVSVLVSSQRENKVLNRREDGGAGAPYMDLEPRG